MAEQTLMDALFTLADHLPAQHCHLSVLLGKDTNLRFKNTHGLKGLAAPLIVITEEELLDRPTDTAKVVLQVGRVKDPDDIRRALAVLSEQAHDESFLRETRKGEIIRRTQEALARHGNTIARALSLLGLG